MTQSGDTFVSMPVPARFVPAVTNLLADLYGSESGGPRPGLATAGDPQRDPAASPSGDGAKPGGGRLPDGRVATVMWDEDDYRALIEKGAVSSERMIAFLDALPVGRRLDGVIAPEALTIPEIADNADVPEANFQQALKWFGKFSRAQRGAGDNPWPFHIERPPYDRDKGGTQIAVAWMEPEQRAAWTVARANGSTFSITSGESDA